MKVDMVKLHDSFEHQRTTIGQLKNDIELRDTITAEQKLEIESLE